jgi:hypothetical protein
MKTEGGEKVTTWNDARIVKDPKLPPRRNIIWKFRSSIDPEKDCW